MKLLAFAVKLRRLSNVAFFCRLALVIFFLDTIILSAFTSGSYTFSLIRDINADATLVSLTAGIFAVPACASFASVGGGVE
ncbi:hypothetical protein [Neorhizobium sp. NCHU2750]|uniref:hypothetical protein n=1 Tax=Neorhizobium sp. NCHU2750 TaxID=1825976 RepID=UPI000E76A611|nr:hypothetical protein NCHU2750_12670 [Neorhizobium sp. NCHU2750]